MSNPREMARDPNSFTVARLKEILRQKELSTAGYKHELISRLFSVDPSVACRSG